MDLFDGLTLLGGLSLFLFGMDVMGRGLERAAGSRLKSTLEALSSGPFRGFLLGLAVTAVIQSSSATTVMAVGLVGSGIMTLRQAAGVIMGANVGTTVTAWLLSLNSIQGAAPILRLLKPSSFAPVLAAVGVVLHLFLRRGRKGDVGQILLGFAVLMFGMDTMSGAVAGLADSPRFGELFLLFSHPIPGLLAGAALTAVLQSSSASVGILQALSATDAVTFGAAIPIILGQNIGTTVTALLASVGGTPDARRAALIHLYFNTVGAAVFLLLFCVLRALLPLPILLRPAHAAGISAVHTLFNLLSTALLLPFTRGLVMLACRSVKDK